MTSYYEFHNIDDTLRPLPRRMSETREFDVNEFRMSTRIGDYEVQSFGQYDPRWRQHVIESHVKAITSGKQEFSETYHTEENHHVVYPANFFEYLKTKLPYDLQFGWLKPRYHRQPYTVKVQKTYQGTVTVFYPAPPGCDYKFLLAVPIWGTEENIRRGTPAQPKQFYQISDYEYKVFPYYCLF